MTLQYYLGLPRGPDHRYWPDLRGHPSQARGEERSSLEEQFPRKYHRFEVPQLRTTAAEITFFYAHRECCITTVYKLNFQIFKFSSENKEIMTVGEIKELVLSKGVFAESTLHKLKKTWKLR
jgi:hypothetical protein